MKQHNRHRIHELLTFLSREHAQTKPDNDGHPLCDQRELVARVHTGLGQRCERSKQAWCGCSSSRPGIQRGPPPRRGPREPSNRRHKCRTLKRGLKNERGQTMTEFAFVLPILHRAALRDHPVRDHLQQLRHVDGRSSCRRAQGRGVARPAPTRQATARRRATPPRTTSESRTDFRRSRAVPPPGLSGPTSRSTATYPTTSACWAGSLRADGSSQR